jgi:hypothetical protein
MTQESADMTIEIVKMLGKLNDDHLAIVLKQVHLETQIQELENKIEELRQMLSPIV